jgi:hypothetical protein
LLKLIAPNTLALPKLTGVKAENNAIFGEAKANLVLYG